MRRLTALAVVAALLAACGDGGDDEDAGGDRSAAPAAASPAAPLTPAEPPAGAEVIEGDGFTIAAPAGFELIRGAGTNGEPVLALQRGEVTVGVVRDPAPPSGPRAQAEIVADQERLVRRSTDVRVDDLPWPGADEAALVRWTSTDGTHAWQLVVQVGTVQLAVVATAPASEIDVATDVLRTFALT